MKLDSFDSLFSTLDTHGTELTLGHLRWLTEPRPEPKREDVLVFTPGEWRYWKPILKKWGVLHEQ